MAGSEKVGLFPKLKTEENGTIKSYEETVRFTNKRSGLNSELTHLPTNLVNLLKFKMKCSEERRTLKLTQKVSEFAYERIPRERKTVEFGVGERKERVGKDCFGWTQNRLTMSAEWDIGGLRGEER